ncbi:Tryptophan synthase alpha chain [Labilithrix luteola]|uniref:Tryptophan synthase alpha chain n=1 Tax=Labilithrix luteola TaxID=1391654 RepID=A0A0K1PNH1_9BACT|nr:hypothetical protein [Labilithrix luteola]AKU95062.1 Tryptophan synthase alpha chain [Labilithrix luteola]
MKDRTGTRPNLRVVPVLVSMVVGMIACSEKLDVGFDQELPAEAGTPSFVTSDAASDGDVTVDAASPQASLCVGTQCPWPLADCPGADGSVAYRCGTDLMTDNANCGSCGNVCPTSIEFYDRAMTTTCVGGKCQLACDNTWGANWSADPRNCNGLVDDGCEIDVASDPDNCGSCGNKCGTFADGTRQRCIDHKCGCPGTQEYCPGIGCVDTTRDPQSCGACGVTCTAPEVKPDSMHMAFGCNASACSWACRPNWGDCDGDPTNGCEASLTTMENCGACKTTCSSQQTCYFNFFDPPVRCICDPNETRCGNACTDLLADPMNCGACGHRCAPPAAEMGQHSTFVCNKGYCGTTCEQGFADCDGDPLNGCETDLKHDAANCGVCGTSCDSSAGQPCVEGRCLTVECDAGVVAK